MKKTILMLALLSIGSMAAANTSTKSVSFLQASKSAVITPVAGKPGKYTLTLEHPAPYVSFFADRPSHVTGIVTLHDYLAKWNVAGKAGFKGNPPNIALECMTPGKNKVPTHLIGTLSQPKYDVKSATISYTLQLHGKVESTIATSQKLGYTVLFIDGADVHWNPGGYGPGSGS